MVGFPAFHWISWLTAFFPLICLEMHRDRKFTISYLTLWLGFVRFSATLKNMLNQFDLSSRVMMKEILRRQFVSTSRCPDSAGDKNISSQEFRDVTPWTPSSPTSQKISRACLFVRILGGWGQPNFGNAKILGEYGPPTHPLEKRLKSFYKIQLQECLQATWTISSCMSLDTFLSVLC